MLDGSATVNERAAVPETARVARGGRRNVSPSEASTAEQSRARVWRIAVLLLVVALGMIVALYRETAGDIVDGWMRTETFAHGFVIIPISAWLIWRLRHRLAGVTPAPQPLALLPLVLAGAAWLVAHSVGVHAPEQFAFVAMISAAVWAILGTEITRRIAFPLAFLFFAVPAGDFLMPALMDQTADFTVAALRLSGIPVFREGNFFTIPSGNWSVVEACSGLRYLIASVTLGCLFAYLNYRSMWRRAAFVAASIAVPIVANWLRAYMIVMLAHLTNNKLATGVDHLIYGWLFFGVVMLALFWVGSWWRDDIDPNTGADLDRERPSTPHGASVTMARSAQRRAGILTAAVVALVLPWPALAAWFETIADASRPGTFTLDHVAGWTRGAPAFTTWTPHYLHSRTTTQENFAAGDREVGLFVGYYSGQLTNGPLVTYSNTVVLVSDKVWAKVGERERAVEAGEHKFSVVETVVRGQGASEGSFLAWRWYWINDRLTDSDYVAKALTAFDKLTGRGDDSAVVVIYTPLVVDQEAAAAATLRAFLTGAEPAISERLAAVREQGRR